LRSGFVIVLAVCSVVWAGEDNSIFRQAYMEQQSLTGRSTHSSSEKGHGTPGRSASYQDGFTVLEASWITVDVPRQRDYRVHDLVTIIVNEVSKSRTKSKSKLERENSIEAILEDWLQIDNHRLRPDAQRGGDPTIRASIEKEFEGKGDTDREDMLTVRITAEIIDVMPNGNLVLEATKSVTTDEDVTRVTLTGQCRGNDIGADNTIISSKLARMEISKTHEGAAHDATKRGFLHRFFDKYALF
jgi:flagellar L-ring protein precursor FlgH